MGPGPEGEGHHQVRGMALCSEERELGSYLSAPRERLGRLRTLSRGETSRGFLSREGLGNVGQPEPGAAGTEGPGWSEHK